jgi:exodeoxyribonuclease V alpha subunit
LDTYQNPDTLISKVKENPYILIDDISGISWHKADSIALNSGMGEFDKNRIKAYVEYFLNQQAMLGNSWVYPNDLLTGILEDVGEDIDRLLLKEVLHEMYENDILYWNEEKTFISKKYYYDLENNIKEHLLRLLNAEAIFEYDNIDIIINNLENEQGWQFTDEQKEAINIILKSNVCIVTGLGGTGKTSCVGAVLKILKDYHFAQTALAGKAASRLQEVTGREGYTIHRLLGFDPRQGFMYNINNPLPIDIVILDETSMVGGKLFFQLIQAIETGSKLIMLGDTGQLESIGLFNIFKDMIDSEMIPTIQLTKIHRQAQKSAIITNSKDVRESKQIVKQGWTGTETRGELQDLILDIYDEKLLTARKMVEWFKKEYQQDRDIMNTQLIVPVKTKGDACTYELNKEIQDIYNPPNNSKTEFKHYKNKKECNLREGDKVIVTVNNYKTTNEQGLLTPVFNGYLGILEEIDFNNSIMIINFDICGRVYISKRYWYTIELAYCITGHKLQGSQCKTVIIGLDFNSYILLTKEWVYTALTRAEKKCILCAEGSALRYAISNSNIPKKQTFLKELLKNKY